MNKKNEKIAELLGEYIISETYQNDIIKYLYQHTELYEKERMQDYRHELFKFISGKITRLANETNKLLKNLDEEEIEIINEKIKNYNKLNDLVRIGI